MTPPVEKILSSPNLPASADVVIIGGGVAGIATALMLARRGVSVVVCEKGEIAAEQSCRNWGWCRAMGRDQREIPLIQESLRLWHGMDQMVEASTGFTVCGIVYAEASEERLAGYETYLDAAAHYQISSRLVSAAELKELVPGLRGPVAGGMYTPTDARAEPFVAVPAMARAVQRLGGTVITQCAVRTLDIAGGRVVGVVTERGRIAASSVVLAGGAWSRLFSGNHGVELPQLKVLGSVLRTKPIEGPPTVSFANGGTSFRKRADGGYTIAHGGLTNAEITPDSFRLFGQFLPAFLREWRGVRLKVGAQFLREFRTPRRWGAEDVSPFEKVRILDPAPNNRVLDAALRNLRNALPSFAGLEEEERWGGYIDVTPDAVPVISDVPAMPGLFISTGFSGHGFGIGPGAGQLMANLVMGDTPVVDPSPFRFGRFSDGSKVTVEAGF